MVGAGAACPARPASSAPHPWRCPGRGGARGALRTASHRQLLSKRPAADSARSSSNGGGSGAAVHCCGGSGWVAEIRGPQCIWARGGRPSRRAPGRSPGLHLPPGCCAPPRSCPLLPPDRPAGQRVQLQPAQRGAFRAAALRRVAAAPRRRAGACGRSMAIRPRDGWAALPDEGCHALQADAPLPAHCRCAPAPFQRTPHPPLAHPCLPPLPCRCCSSGSPGIRPGVDGPRVCCRDAGVLPRQGDRHC